MAKPSSFDDFAFKFSNWLSGLPGDAERFLEESVTMVQPIRWATLTPREKVVARGVAESTACSDRWKGSELYPTPS